MRTRRFGRLGWTVGEIGYGMWGIGGGAGGWVDTEDESGYAALHQALDLSCNFFDTAWIYGRGHSEQVLGKLLAEIGPAKPYVATKIPPKDRNWPSTRDSKLIDVFPAEHIVEYTERSLANLGVPTIDLMQFHVWEDSWAADDSWQRTMLSLKDQGLVNGIGISINRWEPWNVLATLETGLIDAVQVIYNVFDQSPEDELFDYCQEHDIAVIARVPFDEGTLCGTLTEGATWPEGDFRNTYFGPENLEPSIARMRALAGDVPDGMTMPELALRFILQHPAVSVVIPGMRKPAHVAANIGVSDGAALAPDLMRTVRAHRWDRLPTSWSG
jgi:aryl-alcohol dehydrogenase-like predicted oxidoreductase